MQGGAASLVERSGGAGVPWVAGNYSPETLLRAVAVVEDGCVELLQGKIPHQVKTMRKEG